MRLDGQILAMAVAAYAMAGLAGESAEFRLDTMDGPRTARAIETIAYSTAWNNGGDTVSVAVDGIAIKESNAPAWGDVIWNAAQATPGTHTLTHVCSGETLTAVFEVVQTPLPPPTLVAESANWSVGSITLRCDDRCMTTDSRYTLFYYDDSKTCWNIVDSARDQQGTADGKIHLTDTKFASRLGGIAPVQYQVICSDERSSETCVTRTKHGIFVGVGEYGPEYSGLKELGNAPKAVDELESLMMDEGGVDKNNIIVMKNSEATYDAVCNAFATVAEKTKNNPGDICIVYIATHGGSHGTDGKIGSLCLYDKPPKSVDPGGIGYHDKLFENHICSLDPQNKGVAVICILSACHSGAFFESNNNNKACEPIESWCHSEGVGDNVAWVVAADAKSESYDVFGYKFLLQYGWREGWAWNKAHKMDAANAETTDTILFSDLADYAKDMFQNIADCCEISGAKIYDSSGILNKITAGRSTKLECALEKPGKPTNLSATKGKSDKVKVEWERGSGGNPDFYFVIRKFKETDKLEAMIPTEDTFIEESEIASQAYPMQYGVVAINGAGTAATKDKKEGKYEEGWCAINVYKATLFYNLPKGYTIKPNNKTIFVKEGDFLDAELRLVTETIRRWSLGSYEFKGWESIDGSWYILNVTIDSDLEYHAVWSTDQTYGMTQDWLGSHSRISTTSGGDITVAAAMTAANGCRTVAECYALGIDPEDPNDDLKITDFKMEDGKPVITLNHTKDGSGNSFGSRIKTVGKVDLSDATEEWREVPEGGDPEMRFFKVEVEMP